MRNGTTLLELALALCILGILLGAAAAPLDRGLDALATRAARDELAAAMRTTRVTARARGGATLVLDPGAATFTLRTAAGDTLRGPVDLAARHGVSMAVSGAGRAVTVAYDGLGIGRMANRSVRLRRGGAEAGLTISAYGRVRVW
jgi:Tfp pilus assembly protein FimT